MPHFVNQHHEISIVIEVQFHLWSQKGLAGKNWRYLTSWVAIGAPRGPYGSLQGPPASPRSKNLRDPELAEGPRSSPRQGRGPPMMVGGRGGTRGIFDWILTGFCCWWAQGGPLSPTPTIWEHFCFLIFRKLAERHFHISSHLHLVVTRERLTLKIFEFVLVSAWATKDFAFTPDCKNSQINAVKKNSFNGNGWKWILTEC